MIFLKTLPKKILLFSVIFVLYLVNVTLYQTINAQKKYVVVLDAGHGGKDPGGTAFPYKEKIVALKVSLLVGEKLSKHKEIKVIYTRKKDNFIGLWKRGKIANKAKADVFVSIHCNTVKNKYAYGTETFVLGLHANKRNLEVAKKENSAIFYEEDYKKKYKYDPNKPESIIGLTLLQEENLDKSLELASYIENNFKTKLKRKSRGVKQAGFVVLHQTTMPSVLIELGFLSNKKEGRYLNSKKGQSQMAGAIADAILKYVNHLKVNTVSDVEVDVETSKNKVVYKVQIASGKTKITTKSYNFKGLKNVERVQLGNFYKYYFGITSNYKQAIKNLKTAQQKGYTSAFLVAFNNGKKIAIKEAKKLR